MGQLNLTFSFWRNFIAAVIQFSNSHLAAPLKAGLNSTFSVSGIFLHHVSTASNLYALIQTSLFHFPVLSSTFQYATCKRCRR